MRFIILSILLVLQIQAASPIHVMLMDGESGGPYHKWQVTTPVLKKELEETGLFQVDVVTMPATPEFDKYQVVVSNLDTAEWPADLKTRFTTYMRNGGGLVVVHAADNAFSTWPEYNQMIGIGGWRNRNEAAGPHWYFKDGKLFGDTTPGSAGNHGKRIPFQVTMRDTEHPITKGLHKVWMHQGDELYNSLRGPGENMTVLATAFSDPANSGSGHDEPMLMVIQFGKGRVFHTVLGHDVNALSCVGFITTFQRGTEWAATGKVSQKVPTNFPTADIVMYRNDIATMDPNYSKGMNPLDSH